LFLDSSSSLFSTLSLHDALPIFSFSPINSILVHYFQYNNNGLRSKHFSYFSSTVVKVSYITFNSSLVKVNPLPSLVLSSFHHLTSYLGLSPFQLTKLSSFVHPPWLRYNTTISSITFQSTRYFFSIIHNNLLRFNLPELLFGLKHLLHLFLLLLLVHLLFVVFFLPIVVPFFHG